jgi:intein-encoded DNA endonuclease-like protein
MPKRCSKETEELVVSLYKQGLNTVEIAKETGLANNTSVRRILLRNNIPLISTGDRLRKVHHNPFADLTNPETQYWLGYIASDGCVSDIKGKASCVRICTNKDPEHLEKYIEFLKAPVNVNRSWNKKYGVYEYAVGFSNVMVVDFLISLGITPRKSLTLKLNFNFTWDFIRGYFDGNGTVHKTSTYIFSGSKSFIDQALDYMQSQGVNCWYRLIKENVHAAYVSGVSDNRRKFISYLYSDLSAPALHRKRDILLGSKSGSPK